MKNLLNGVLFGTLMGAIVWATIVVFAAFVSWDLVFILPDTPSEIRSAMVRDLHATARALSGATAIMTTLVTICVR